MVGEKSLKIDKCKCYSVEISEHANIEYHLVLHSTSFSFAYELSPQAVKVRHCNLKGVQIPSKIIVK